MNDNAIAEWIHRVHVDGGTFLVAWGARGGLHNRDRHVLAMSRSQGVDPVCLRVTREGFPEHPLYLPKSLCPIPYLGRPETRLYRMT